MAKRWVMVIGVVLVGSLGVMADSTPIGPSFLFCHNGRLLCADEENAIRAHNTHVTNGQQCVLISGPHEIPCPDNKPAQ